MKKFILLSRTLTQAARHACHALQYPVTLPHVLKTHYAKFLPFFEFWPLQEEQMNNANSEDIDLFRSPYFTVQYIRKQFRINGILWMTLSDPIKWGTVHQETTEISDALWATVCCQGFFPDIILGHLLALLVSHSNFPFLILKSQTQWEGAFWECPQDVRYGSDGFISYISIYNSEKKCMKCNKYYNACICQESKKYVTICSEVFWEIILTPSGV